MSWYRTGTVTVTNGSPNVTGAGTSWLTAIAPGWGFVGPDGRVYEVLSVGGNGSLVLGSNYTGTTAAGQSYAAYPTQSEIRELAAQVVSLISDYSTVRDTAASGKFEPGTVAAPGISSVSDSNTGLHWPAADVLALGTAGVERMRVSASGNVGIGTSAPVTPLDINHATDTRARLLLGGVSAMQMQSVAGANRIASNTSDPLEFWTNGARRAALDSTGRLGIGTATPLFPLHVASTNPAVLLDETDAVVDNKRWRILAGGTSLAISAGNDANDVFENAYVLGRSGVTVTSHSFRVNNMQSLQIGSTGNVGMGVAAQTRLHVAGSSADAKIRLQSVSVGAADLTQGSAGLELIAADANTASKFMPAIKFGSTDSQFTTTNPKFGAVIVAEAAETFASDTAGGMALSFLTAPLAAEGNTAAGVLVEALRLDARQNAILRPNTVPPALTVNQTMVFNLTSNTNLRISARGTDGVTRVANITLA